jgi:hypothetical protein
MSWLPRSSSKLAKTATIGLRIIEVAFGLAIVAYLVVVLFGGNMLERQRPSEGAYIADYLEYFDGSQIEKLDYTYQGAIGGVRTVGRAKFKGPIKLRDGIVEAKIKAGLTTRGMYDPAEMTKEPAATLFRHEWEGYADGAIPSWFDFPFDRKMRTLTEAGKGSNAEPRYEKVWYIDDDRNIIYIRGNWG